MKHSILLPETGNPEEDAEMLKVVTDVIALRPGIDYLASQPEEGGITIAFADPADRSAVRQAFKDRAQRDNFERFGTTYPLPELL